MAATTTATGTTAAARMTATRATATAGTAASAEQSGGPDDDLRSLLHDEIGRLPERLRLPVVLCDLEEVDYAEAAVILACPIGTVRSRMHRARALLLEKLNQDRKPRLAVDAWKPMRYAI